MNRIFFILFILLSGYAFAQPSEADFLLLRKDYVLYPDGSIDLNCRQIVKYHTHVSFNRLYGETFIVYNPKHQQLKINESYTTQASGNKIVTPSNAFNEVLPRFAADAPDYNHLREMVVTHTGLEVGATSYLDYTLHTDAGYEPELDRYLTLQEESPVKEYVVTATVPDGKTLSYQLYGIKGNPKITKKNGTTRYEWTFRNIAASSREYYQPEDGRNAPHLIFSTWPSLPAAMQWLAGQVKADQTPEMKVQIEKTAKNDQNNSNIGTARTYNYVVGEFAYTPVPLEYNGYKLRSASQAFKSAYGTAAEKMALLMSAMTILGEPVEPVAIYPSFFEGKVGSLHAIMGFAVSVNDSDRPINNPHALFLWSPVERVKYTLSLSKPDYLYIKISENPTATDQMIQSEAKISMNIDIDAEQVNTKGELSVSGKFYPYVDMLLDVNTPKRLLDRGTIDKFSKSESDLFPLSISLDGKLSVKELDGYRSFILPEVRDGANSWYMPYLLPSRQTNLEISSPFSETYHYEVKATGGMSFINKDISMVKKNKLGSVKVEIKFDTPNLCKVTRSIELNNNIVSPKEYADFLELINIWRDTNYRTIILTK